jgi:hypothetical protein
MGDTRKTTEGAEPIEHPGEPEQTVEGGFDEGERTGPRDPEIGRFDTGVGDPEDPERHKRGRFDEGTPVVDPVERDREGAYDVGERDRPRP